MNLPGRKGSRLEVRHIPGPLAGLPWFLHKEPGSASLLWAQRGPDWPQALCAATRRAGRGPFTKEWRSRLIAGLVRAGRANTAEGNLTWPIDRSVLSAESRWRRPAFAAPNQPEKVQTLQMVWHGGGCPANIHNETNETVFNGCHATNPCCACHESAQRARHLVVNLHFRRSRLPRKAPPAMFMVCRFTET